WEQLPIRLFGKEILQPRLTCFYGDRGISYRYSGRTIFARLWDEIPVLKEALAEVENAMGLGGESHFFNCVLCNMYRGGTDYMGWHSGEK
ncbi:unnamed protein product, partial [Choristocarpus tenellus]